MKKITDLFSAKSASLWDTMMSHNGSVGYRIPEYQRTYDWSHSKIKRMLEDCLSGFVSIANPHKLDPYTFFGTLILVEEKKAEGTFEGISMAVVDGQQRLTTMVLISCALVEAIKTYGKIDGKLSADTKQWLEAEAKHQKDMLYQCTTGQIIGTGELFPFPRIVRDTDNRANSGADSEYRSYISRFIEAFYKSFNEDDKDFSTNAKVRDSSDERFLDNYRYIKSQLNFSLVDPDHEKADIDFVTMESCDLEKKHSRSLFKKLDILHQDADKDRALSEACKSNQAVGMLRLLAFSSYVTRNIVFTRVETDNEDAAFDIFDALNTTGEPLTALETFKPRVIKSEKSKLGYQGSESEESFNRIEKNLNDLFQDTDKRQRETKDLLVTFALYLEGHKLPLDLSSQRLFLRSRYEELALNGTIQEQRRLVSSIADVAEFRQIYWTRSGIDSLSKVYATKDFALLQLCLLFMQDMNTTLSIPIMARYWVDFQSNQDETKFIDAIKAITAFIILRRSITGGTGGIDTDLRKIMDKTPKDAKAPLSIGKNHDNEIWDVAFLKKQLRQLLATKKLGIKDRESWVTQVSETQLARHSRPLSRFILLAASHNSRPDLNKPGLLKRDGVIPSDEIAFMTPAAWLDDKYSTVEHVAPESNPGSGWEEDIYKKQSTRQLIGNVVLLPQKENSAVGNYGWDRKRVFYSALIAKDTDEREKSLQLAKDKGFQFTKKTEAILREGSRLHMLDFLGDVEKWDETFIHCRTKNTLELAWDTFAEWLYE